MSAGPGLMYLVNTVAVLPWALAFALVGCTRDPELAELTHSLCAIPSETLHEEQLASWVEASAPSKATGPRSCAR